jgi:hypothetical protein
MQNNQEYICCDEEQFSATALTTFLDSNPVHKARLIAERLFQHLVISNGIVYLYDTETVTYKPINQVVNDYVLTIARRLIVNSFENLSDKKMLEIVKKYDKEIGGPNCSLLFKLDYYRDFLLDICLLITNNAVIFENNKYESHYRNGYLNLKTQQFKARDPDVHFVKDFLNEDYRCKTAMDSDSEEEVDEDEDVEEEEEEEDEEEAEEEENVAKGDRVVAVVASAKEAAAFMRRIKK